MNSNHGYTLIEIMIATLIMLFVSLGFFAWSFTIIRGNVASQKMDIAYTMAMEIGEKLAMIPDENNEMIQHDPGGVLKTVGFDDTDKFELKDCGGTATPQFALNPTPTGLTRFTDPWDSMNNLLFLYDMNTCSDLNPFCLPTGVIIHPANTNIDHPNNANIANPVYDTVNPVRFLSDTTFYAVWSVAYLPCVSPPSITDKRKLFVTVYWLDPEPDDPNIANVTAGIVTGTYILKSTSVVVDKVIGVE